MALILSTHKLGILPVAYIPPPCMAVLFCINVSFIESATSLLLKKEAWWKALLDEKISDLLIRGFGTAMMPYPSDGQPVFEVMPVALSALLDAHDDKALQKLVKTRGGATAIQDFLARGLHIRHL